jgi:3',5'-cyclic AMP phosphodiesterase CpdA
MKFIHVTDTHLVPTLELLYGLEPRARLDACIADINARHADAAFCIITGDLTHWGQAEAYGQLREALAALRLPVYLLIGNHDHRGNFLQAFPEVPLDGDGFVQTVIDSDSERFILLDSNEMGVHWGVLCDRRLAWLATRLAEDASRPVYLFIHHPPFPVGIKKMDRQSLQEPERLWSVLAPHRERIRHLFFGHLHRPICGSWRGIPFSTMRATSHQVALDFTIEDKVPGSHEPPAYAVVLIDDDRVIVHFHDFLDRSATFNL